MGRSNRNFRQLDSWYIHQYIPKITLQIRHTVHIPTVTQVILDLFQYVFVSKNKTCFCNLWNRSEIKKQTYFLNAYLLLCYHKWTFLWSYKQYMHGQFLFLGNSVRHFAKSSSFCMVQRFDNFRYLDSRY